MESLLRAVLTSSDNLETFRNSSQPKGDIKLANPHLHAALTSTQLKPRPAMKLTKSAVEQPPGDTACDKRSCQPYQKTTSRHSKLLEALISGANHPIDNNSQSSLNPNSNGFKTDKNSKKHEALHKSRLFMALTSPIVSLDNWSHQNRHNLNNQPENKPAKCKANGAGFQDVQVNWQLASQNVSGQNNTTLVAIKTEQATKDEISTAKSNNLSDKNQTIFNGNSNSFDVESQTPASVQNCSSYKKAHTANTTKVHIKSELQSQIINNTDSSWENKQDQKKMVSTNNQECKMETEDRFNGGFDVTECRGNDHNNECNGLSGCLTVKKECRVDDKGDSIICDKQVKVESENYCSTTSHYFSSSIAIGANISTKSLKPLTAKHRQKTEPSNLCTILQSHKRKNSDLVHNSHIIKKADRVDSVPCKRKKVLIEKNSKLLSVNKTSTHSDLFETDLDSPTPHREAGIFQKKSNTDAQILRRVLTEGIGELRSSTNSQQSVASSPKSFVTSQITDRQHSTANVSPISSSIAKPNINQQEKPPIKSQILRAALTSVEPIVSLRKPNSEFHSSSQLKISPTAIKTETSPSGLNVIPHLCSNPLDSMYSSGASAVKNGGEKISSVFSNSNGQDSIQTAAAEDRPQKTKCQLLLAALTASDNSKKSNLLNANESAPKQTSSEILRAALNNAERDSQGIGAKHSQLLRAALTAVDTNQAAKSWHQTNSKLNNSRLLRAVLTGKYIPDTVDYTDYSKVTHHKGGPMSCESKNEFSVSNTKLGTVTRSYDIVEITPNLGAAAASKKDKIQKVIPSINCNSRSSGHSILRAVLTGAIDIPQRVHESTKNNNVKHPELVASTNENHKESEVVSSCYSNIQDKKVINNNNSQTLPLSSSSSSLSSSSSSLSSSSSSSSESGCKEQCCEYCGKYHSRSDSLWEYTSLFAGDTPHSCYMCNQSFSVTCLFLDHMETHTDVGSKYKCEFCGRHFKHVLSYIMCRLSHIDAQKEEKVSCNLCNCEFTCHNKLKQHTRIHAKDRFTCKFCGKEFHQRVSCYLHERDHVDNKMSFTCKMCGEKFALSSDLKAHQHSHYTGELFKCSRCIKCFVNQKTLRLHEKTHIPVDHQDSECKKVFMHNDNLHHHQCGSSREKRKFLCEGCGLICTSRYSLAKHKATCGGTPYTDKKFQMDMVSHSLVTIKD